MTSKTAPTKFLSLLLFLCPTISQAQNDLIEHQDQKRQEIESLIVPENLEVLVKIAGQKELKKVINKNWPQNIDITFNILKNESGKIVYIGEFPTSESGDWNLELKHFFDDNGHLVAFEQRLAFFNEECTDGAVVEDIIELYDSSFKVIKTTKTLTDNNGKPINSCDHAYDWKYDKRPTVAEFIKLKGIK